MPLLNPLANHAVGERCVVEEDGAPVGEVSPEIASLKAVNRWLHSRHPTRER